MEAPTSCCFSCGCLGKFLGYGVRTDGTRVWLFDHGQDICYLTFEIDGGPVRTDGLVMWEE